MSLGNYVSVWAREDHGERQKTARDQDWTE